MDLSAGSEDKLLGYVCYVAPLEQPTYMTRERRVRFLPLNPGHKESIKQKQIFTEPFVEVWTVDTNVAHFVTYGLLFPESWPSYSTYREVQLRVI